MLILDGSTALAGAREGVQMCLYTVIPALFPFFVLSDLLSSLGLADLLAGLLGGAAERLFRVSGAGAQAFFLGVTGG
jgi:hypothetical protein